MATCELVLAAAFPSESEVHERGPGDAVPISGAFCAEGAARSLFDEIIEA